MDISTSNIVARYLSARLLQSGVKSEWVSGGERQSFLDDVWVMYKSSYQKIGMHISSPSTLLNYDRWKIILDDSPVAFQLYKSTPFGLKTGLLGSDGLAVGKVAIKNLIKTQYHQQGVYGEVSHVVEHICESAPVVCSIYTSKILGKSVFPLEDGIHYKRNLEGLGFITKKMVGLPRGCPINTNGVCPIPEEPGEEVKPTDRPDKIASDKISQEIELAEHFASHLDI